MKIEFTYLINECLCFLIMPDKWKIGIITLMPKGRISLNPGNRRPVSVPPMPSKVMEKVIYRQLVNFFENNALSYVYQHGFRRGLSTSTAVMEYVQYLYQAFDRRQTTSSIYVDYKHAFDTIIM